MVIFLIIPSFNPVTAPTTEASPDKVTFFTGTLFSIIPSKVGTNNISSEKVPELKNGDKVRVLYIGEITGTETLVLKKTVSIFLLDDDNEVIVE